jgi:translation initiation factor IF-1
VYEAPILAKAEVIKILKPDLYELRLPNGKMTLGHLSKALKGTPEPEVGTYVTLELTPFDFDTARVSAIG